MEDCCQQNRGRSRPTDQFTEICGNLRIITKRVVTKNIQREIREVVTMESFCSQGSENAICQQRLKYVGLIIWP